MAECYEPVLEIMPEISVDLDIVLKNQRVIGSLSNDSFQQAAIVLCLTVAWVSGDVIVLHEEFDGFTPVRTRYRVERALRHAAVQTWRIREHVEL